MTAPTSGQEETSPIATPKTMRQAKKQKAIPCGCFVSSNTAGEYADEDGAFDGRIHYCPTHAAAPQMVDAMQHAIDRCGYCQGTIRLECESCKEFAALLATVEGRT